MAGSLREIIAGSTNLLLFLSLTISAFRCDNEKDPEYVFMIFEIPITITPGGSELSLGDTLWVSGSFPDTLKDIHSGMYFRLKEFDFKSKICLNKINDPNLYLSQQPPAFSDFDVSGLFQTSSVCGTFILSYTNNSYSYRVVLIPRALGVFTIFMLRPVDSSDTPENYIDLTPFIDLGITADERERIPIYEAFQFVINNGETNFELYKQFSRPGIDVVPSEELGSFTFRVVE